MGDPTSEPARRYGRRDDGQGGDRESADDDDGPPELGDLRAPEHRAERADRHDG
jgi:hypothetical protein